MQTPPELMILMRQYLSCIFWGIPATFLYNYFANVLRSVGNSAVPLLFLAISAIMNIILDLVFVLALHWGCLLYTSHMAYYTAAIRSQKGEAPYESMQQALLDKHFLRKHGANAYYGQN